MNSGGVTCHGFNENGRDIPPKKPRLCNIISQAKPVKITRAYLPGIRQFRNIFYDTLRRDLLFFIPKESEKICF